MTYIEEDFELGFMETLMVMSSLTTLAVSIVMTAYQFGAFV